MSAQLPNNQYVNVGKIKTRFWVAGSNTPPIIFLHGLGGYVENWEDNFLELSKIRQVYALDLVGFGLSDKPEVEYSLQYLTEFVREFMISSGIEKATMIGESMGGAIALQLALQFPENVEKIVLAASSGLGKEISINLRMVTLPILGEILSRPSREGTAQFLEQIFHHKDIIQDEWIEIDYQMSSVPGVQRSLLSALRSMCNIWGSRRKVYLPILENLHELEVPVLIIWGAQDQIIPVSHAHRAKKRLSNARIHILDQCGHVPNIECADEFNLLVGDFMSVS
jgi:4,5:9,10-diseco-3-hydroxy-5,9,17-trioxoandrosta-1(10),2-diene-4-oate hydrolase